MRTRAAVASPSLATALEALRARGLGLRRATEAPSPVQARPALSSGYPTLDAALGTAGWPRGALASLHATPGSGATTLAFASLAACQRSGGLVAWLDVEGSFDPATASRAGIDLGWLLVVRPRDGNEAIELAAWLARGGLIDAFVLDLYPAALTVPRAAIDRLARLLARAGSVGLMLGGDPVAASIRVALERQAWLSVGHDVVGQRVTARVERHRWAAVGTTAELNLWFAEGRRIDSLLVARAEPQPVAVAVERPVLQVLGA